MKNKLKAALSAAKKTAGRELGLFMFMMVFGLVAAIVAFPLILVLAFLPDWAWIALIVAAITWFFVGDTIKAAIGAYRNYQG